MAESQANLAWVRWAPDPGARQPAAAVRDTAAPARLYMTSGRPDLTGFPVTSWAEAIRKAAATEPNSELGYPEPALREAAASGGLVLVPLAVHKDGMRVDELAAHPEVGAACVGATHQFPAGAVLSPGRTKGPRFPPCKAWLRRGCSCSVP